MITISSAVLQIIEEFPAGEEFTASRIIDTILVRNPRMRKDSLRSKVPVYLRKLVSYGIVECAAERVGPSPSIWRRV